MHPNSLINEQCVVICRFVFIVMGSVMRLFNGRLLSFALSAAVFQVLGCKLPFYTGIWIIFTLNACFWCYMLDPVCPHLASP